MRGQPRRVDDHVCEENQAKTLWQLSEARLEKEIMVTIANCLRQLGLCASHSIRSCEVEAHGRTPAEVLEAVVEDTDYIAKSSRGQAQAKKGKKEEAPEEPEEDADSDSSDGDRPTSALKSAVRC